MAVPTTKLRKTNRRFKSHKKSRGACGTCRFRKIKCDETKPTCKRCEIYSTICKYDKGIPDLQPSAHGASAFQVLQAPICSEKQTMLGILNNSPTNLLTSGSHPPDYLNYQLTTHDLSLLHRFQTTTIQTLGPAEGRPIYQNACAKLTFSHPFLLHIALTLTLMHENHLSPSSPPSHSNAIAFHWSRGASLLNRTLSTTIPPSSRDALWLCAGFLGALAFSSIEATTPEEAWPLKPSSPTDLEWLKLSEGKKEIWKIADPMRPDSLFHSMTPHFIPLASSAFSISDLQCLPPELLTLCNITPTSSQTNNPYLSTLTFLAQTATLNCTPKTIGTFLSFFGRMHPDFKQLLLQKDPCALVLLAHWFAKMCKLEQWWIHRRAHLECEAICRYLTRHHGDDDDVLAAMRYPEMIYKLIHPRE